MSFLTDLLRAFGFGAPAAASTAPAISAPNESKPATQADPKSPTVELANIAYGEIGTEEDKAHTNKGEGIAKYQAADDYTPTPDNGYAWCASFVCWCVREFLKKFPAATALKITQRPTTPAAFGLRTWGNETPGCEVFRAEHAPRAGDIVVYAVSHCGIVFRSTGATTFEAIEGNTNTDGSRDGYRVCRKSRKLAEVLCFVRLPNPQAK